MHMEAVVVSSDVGSVCPFWTEGVFSMMARLSVAAAVLFAAGGIVNAQSLTTLPPDNGSGGVFLDLTPISQPLDVTSFEVPYSGPAGTPVQVEVWTRPGSYVGFDGSSAG
jgi:hypothetical protein